MDRNNRRNDENWLAPVTQQMFEKFLHDVAGLFYLENREHCYNVASIPFFVAQGQFCKNMEERHGSLYLGEYGPIIHDDEVAVGETDFEKLLKLDEINPIMKEIYTEWIKLVAKANEGRLVNGKNYLCTLQSEAHEYIVAKRDNEIQSIIGRANKKTVNLVKLLHETCQYQDDEKASQ